MLVLSRKTDESIRIGPDVEVMIVAVDRERGTVRLGIKAPRDVLILRSEMTAKDEDHCLAGP